MGAVLAVMVIWHARRHHPARIYALAWGFLWLAMAAAVAERMGWISDVFIAMPVIRIVALNAVRFVGDQPEPRIEIGCRRESEETACYVRDNGIGIEPRFHDKVFGLFERLDAETEGTGVGLALVKRIIEFHGGRIWVESAGKGSGTIFWFVIPET